MIDDEVRTALRELVTEIGALSARIVDADDARTGVPARTLALGGGEFLRVELPTRTSREHDVEAAFERATRQLRAIRRRWEVARLPEIIVTAAAGGDVAPASRVVERIEGYLVALAQIERASNAFVTRDGKLVAAARPPDEAESSRLQFLARRALTTHAPGSSHGEIADPDAFAITFWYDAALVVMLAEPYALDFIRHRCKQVARELAVLLPLLDPEPDAPAAMRRRPPTLP
nr:hypothetical protein [Kofleriaceae bacterium]